MQVYIANLGKYNEEELVGTWFTPPIDMEDIARNYVEEIGMLGEIPANLQNYIDYQAFDRDLNIEENFLVTSHGVFEHLG